MIKFSLIQLSWAIVNIVLMNLGATLQSRSIVQDTKKNWLTFFGFCFMTLGLVIVSLFDPDIKNVYDFDGQIIAGFVMAICSFSLIFSKKIIVTLTPYKLLIYLFVFSILILEHELLGFAFILHLLIIAISMLLILTKLPDYLRDPLEMLVYSWVALMLFASAFISYNLLISSSGDTFSFMEFKNNPWFFLSFGGIFFQAGITIFSFLLMLPIFKGKREPFYKELKRAKEHRREVTKKFTNDSLTGLDVLLFSVVIFSLVLIDYYFNLSYTSLLYVALLASSQIFYKNTTQLLASSI